MNKTGNGFYGGICDKYLKDVYEFCRYITRYKEEFTYIVEESTQETFLEAKIQIKKLKNHPNIKGWLYVTARNFVNNATRKHYTKNKYEIGIHNEIACSHISVEDKLEKKIEDKIDVSKVKKDILKQLKKTDYQFYTDYFVKKMSIMEMAVKYGVSVSAIYTRIHRLKIKIKKMAEEYFINEY